MIKINKAVIVEGKYDKIKLSGLIDAVIISTDGFRIFKDRETIELIKTFAELSGIIILTDSDAAGFKIRNYIRSAVGDKNIKNIYIPDIYGKEKRKAAYSAERKLGVEGMPDELLISLFESAGCEISKPDEFKITKAVLYEDGLTGGSGSAERRRVLKKKLGLPERMSTNAMLGVLNSIYGYEKYKKTVKDIEEEYLK